MDAREYLGQILRIRDEIKRRKEKIDEMRYSCIGIGSMTGDADRVQTTPSINGRYGTVDKMLDMERELEKRKLQYTLTLERVNETIERVPNEKQRMALRGIWLQGHSFRTMSKLMHVSHSCVQYHNNMGIECIQKLLDEKMLQLVHQRDKLGIIEDSYENDRQRDGES